jgi:hypothetical protein
MASAVSHSIYAAAGSPTMPGAVRGVCRLCGEEGTGEAFDRWVKDTFTDHDKLKSGTITCHACLFCASEATPGLAERVGKDKPQKLRNYSHIVKDGVWTPLSKGQKSELRGLLLDAPDVALIATSGQKHLFFRSTVGWWQVEEQSVRPDPALLRLLLDRLTTMLAVFSKAEIETRRYEQRRVLAYGVDAWRGDEAALMPHRGGALFTLALFLAQKEEPDNGLSADS